MIKSFLILIILTFCFQTVVAQDEKPWTLIKSENKDFSFSLPADFLAYSRPIPSKVTLLYAYQDGVSIEIELHGYMNNSEYISNKKKKPKSDFYQIIGDSLFFEKPTSEENNYSRNLIFTTPQGSYNIVLTGSKVSQDFIEKFLAGIKVGKEKLPLAKTNEPKTSATVVWQELKTSPEIVKILKKKPGEEKYQTDYQNFSTVMGSYKFFNDKEFTRPPFIIEFGTSEIILVRGRQITVVLEAKLLASGEVGDIKVLYSRDKDDAKMIAKFFRKTKFIPAQFNGVNVDINFLFTFDTMFLNW